MRTRGGQRKHFLNELMLNKHLLLPLPDEMPEEQARNASFFVHFVLFYAFICYCFIIYLKWKSLENLHGFYFSHIDGG